MSKVVIGQYVPLLDVGLNNFPKRKPPLVLWRASGRLLGNICSLHGN